MGQNSKSSAQLITRLSEAIGVTGYAGPNNIQEVIAAELSAIVDKVERDRMGSVIGVKQGEQQGETRRKIMLAAHLDEIGAVVTKIDHGFLRFTQIGGLDTRVLMGQEVTVYGRRNLPGLIGSIPPHFLSSSERDNKIQLDQLHVDVGLPPKQVENLVSIGDLISFVSPSAELLNGLRTGKAMDNRASVAAMLVCLQMLQTMRHQWDVYAVATADEEWGLFLGATTQAYAIRPDVAIVLDVTFADVEEIEIKLDKGPSLGLGPTNHPAVRQRLVDLCQELELKYQTEMMPSGVGTDAFAVEISREGVPTILISVPNRYMHTPVEVVQPKDVERTGRLMAHFIARLDEDFVTQLIPD